MIFIRKKKLMAVLKVLEDCACDQSKACGNTEEDRMNNFYWRCGNANAVDFIKYKLKL